MKRKESIKFSILFMILLSFTFFYSINLVKSEQISQPLSITVSCSNSTYANISYAKYQANSLYLINLESIMTKNSGYYNYTINANLITQTGTIEYVYHCDVNGIDTKSGNTIYISLLGENLTTGQGILYVIMLVGLFLIFIITIIGGIYFPWKNNRDEEGKIISINDLKYLKIVLWILVYLELLFIVAILENLSGYLISPGIYSFFNITFNILLIGLLPFFPCLIAFTIIIWLSDKKTQKELKRGLPIR